MKRVINSLVAFGESALAFLTAWCMMAPVSLPKVHLFSHRSSILPAVHGVSRSLSKAASRSSEMRQCIKLSSLDNQLASISLIRNQVMQQINSVYSASEK